MSRCHALVIGNAEYADSASFEPLKYAGNDADDVFRLLTDLRTGIFDKNTSVCHKNPSCDEMPNMLSEFFKPINPSDLVLIYYAGHAELLGNKRLSLIMRNTEKNNLAGTAFNTERFVDYFEDKKIQRYIVILDCCRAGKALKSPGVVNRGDANTADLRNLSGRGKIFVASAGEHQLAKESDSLRHGLFGNYFIQGIETGEAGNASKSVIDIFEICEYVQTKIADNHADIYQEIAISGENIMGELPVAKNPNFMEKSKQKIDISSLPSTSSDLFGRNRELELLDTFWNNPKTNIAVLVAWGGVGKTALVNKWLNLMAQDDFRGAERVFGWSFYSQGAAEDKQASADRFIADALRWFGDPNPNEGDPIAKGKRLSELIRRRKTLLILDGLEPLQHPPGHDEGRLKDPGLRAMLRDLAIRNPGLCVITTRLRTDDLKSSLGTSVEKIELSHLAPEDGASLLRHLNVSGTEMELRQASKDFGGHSLALTLLGTYLSAVCGGDVRQKDKIECLMISDEPQANHARRVMESYEIWMRTTDKGRRELNILRIMGLFDRPAEPGAISALLTEPEIPGLTDKILESGVVGESGFAPQWHFDVMNLRDLRLISEKDKARPDMLDCHPLIREHFAEKLRKENHEAWKQAHSRLYEYYKNLPKKQLPDTLEEMEPLFAAVAHGCQAERHQEALNDVYWERIKRKKDHYCTAKLGAFGSDLSALSNFFENLWTKPAEGLSDDFKAVVLSWAGFRLRALGRLREAAQPMRAGLEARIRQENWKEAAINAGNLSELCLTIGDVPQAVSYSRQSVEFADKSGDDFQRESKRTALADALHHANDISESLRLFSEAEAMQKERQPEYSYLYSLPGFRYCDLLLSQGKYREVLERFEKFLQWRLPSDSLLDIAFENLSAGKAYLLRTQEQGSEDFAQAEKYLNQAVEGLVKAGRQDHQPRGLLARAALYRLKNEFPKARTDLEDAFEIADRSEMKLYLTDYHLESCRLCIAENKPDEAKKHLGSAKALIEETGYRRREREAGELGQILEHDSRD